MRLSIAALVFVLTACGQPPPSEPVPAIPEWAKVAPEQIAAAKKYGVPVAFENDLGMRFVLIPEGTFLMGSPDSEREAVAREGGDEVDLSDQGLAAEPGEPTPERVGAEWMDDETLHAVTLSRPYYIAVYEVTNAEYAHWDPEHDSGDFSGLSLAQPQQPVARVTWREAAAFAEWLSRRAKRTYRLPTEVEWEYACRAGSSTRYPWGDEVAVGHLHANGNDLVTSQELGFTWQGWENDDGYRVSAPVGAYPANGYGLHDMTGNVWEWCEDWYGPLAASEGLSVNNI